MARIGVWEGPDRNGPKTEHSARKCFQQRRLCGIPFMILLVGLLAFILGGALGGGLGGAIAVGRFHKTRPTTTTTITLTPTHTSSGLDLTSGPTQTACPSNKIFTPINPVTNDPYIINSTNSVFTLYCQSDIFNANSSGSQPKVLQELYNISTLQNCVLACTQYNYQIRAAAVFDGGEQPIFAEESVCDGVFWGYNGTLSYVNDHPTRCYLKNGVTTNMVQAQITRHAAILNQ